MALGNVTATGFLPYSMYHFDHSLLPPRRKRSGLYSMLHFQMFLWFFIQKDNNTFINILCLGISLSISISWHYAVLIGKKKKKIVYIGSSAGFI